MRLRGGERTRERGRSEEERVSGIESGMGVAGRLGSSGQEG